MYFHNFILSSHQNGSARGHNNLNPSHEKKTQFVAEDAQSCKAGAIKYNLRFFSLGKVCTICKCPNAN